LTTSIRFRFADTADIAPAAAMIAHSFPGAERTPEWRDASLRTPAWGGGAETLLLGVEGERIVAALQAHRQRMLVGGAGLACCGIGTVAIAPTHRRRGAAARLMHAALHEARTRGDVVSALYPFRTSFYGRLGYGVAGIVEQHRITPSHLRDDPLRARVQLLDTDASRTEALALYHSWIRTQNGQMLRPDAVWRDIVIAHDRALFGWRNDAGALEGYAVVAYIGGADRYLDVDEIVWTTRDARLGLYGWLASLADQWPALIMRALPSQRLSDFIEEPRLPRSAAPLWRLWVPAWTQLLGPMYRLLDVAAAFNARTLRNDVDVTFTVSDTVIAENSGTWRLTGTQGTAGFERSTTSHPDVQCDVATLSRLHIGAISATQAHAAGLLQCDDGATLHALDRALALPEPWTFARF